MIKHAYARDRSQVIESYKNFSVCKTFNTFRTGAVENSINGLYMYQEQNYKSVGRYFVHLVDRRGKIRNTVFDNVTPIS